MGAKTLIFLALIVSAIFIYTCIDNKKDAFYAQFNNTDKVVQTPKLVKEIESEENKTQVSAPIMIEQKAPSFAYISGENKKIVGHLSNKDKDADIITQIDKICQSNNCVKKLDFFEDITPFAFTKDTFSLIEYAKKEELKEFALFIEKKSIKLVGELKSQEQKESIKPFLDAFINAGYTVDNKMKSDNLTPIVKEEIIKEEIITKEETPVVVPNHLEMDDASSKISRILSANNITFDYKSTNISDESKKTLNQVIDILLELDSTTITVAGYTDSKGGAVYNKVLSQKRADAVRTYLIESGVRRELITSIGYGEENPIGEPEDKINRRVEIHLSEGKE